MKVTYIRGSEESGARFRLRRVGWEPSGAAKKIAEYFSKEIVIANVGGGHGRDTLWLVGMVSNVSCSSRTSIP